METPLAVARPIIRATLVCTSIRTRSHACMQALAHHRQWSLSAPFWAWRTAAAASAEHGHLLHVAAAHRRHTALSTAFLRWVESARERAWEAQLTATAAQHWRLHAAAHALRCWAANTAELRGHRQKVWCLRCLDCSTIQKRLKAVASPQPSVSTTWSVELQCIHVWLCAVQVN